MISTNHNKRETVGNQNFSHLNDTTEKMIRQGRDWKPVFIIYKYDKGLVSRVYKWLL